MAAKSNEKPAEGMTEAVRKEAPQKEMPDTKRVVFKVEKLREKCVEIFGITTSTFDGAFHGNSKTEMSISEASERINKWLGRKG